MNKSEKIYDGITNVEDKMIEDAQDSAEKAKKPAKWLPWAGIAAAACLAVGVGAVVMLSHTFGGISISGTPADTSVTRSYMPEPNEIARLLMTPVYPEMPAYVEEDDIPSSDQPEYEKYEKLRNEHWEFIRELRNQPKEYKDGTGKFFTESIKTLLPGNGENCVCSPLSLFMALGMSAEITDGNTRRQILDLLGQDSIESLRSHSASIWQANYMDDGMAKCVLANSVWMNNDISYSQEALNRLCIDYYASSFSGEPETEEYDELLQDWLNKQTGGQLDEYVGGIKLDPETVVCIASTVDYAGKWITKFSADQTKPAVFHSPDGDIECDFLNADLTYMTPYYWGDKFAATEKSFENNGCMRLILPDEGVSPEELLSDEEALSFMLHYDYFDEEEGKFVQYPNKKLVEGDLSVPKFDISAELDLKDALIKMGITDIFDADTADFSSLTDGDSDGIFLSGIKQAARVQIDEEGCRASALTVGMYTGAPIPEDTVDLVFDRPFIFEIISATGLPLFVGIVNNPVQ